MKDIYEVEFDYHPRISLHNTKRFLHDKNVFEGFLKDSNPSRGYDVVINSGVLYHVFDLLGTLGLSRSLLREGGLLVMETATSVRDEFIQIWNFNHQWLYPNGTNTWFITARLLDHFLRFLRFKIVDVAYIENANDVKRVAVTAQATNEILATKEEEEWFFATTRNFDYDFFCDLEFAQGRAKKVPYKSDLGEDFFHKSLPSIDLHHAILRTDPLEVSNDQVRLHLKDKL